MSKIYELDNSLFNKINLFRTNDKFIFTDKNKRNVIAVDNSNGAFFVEEFSNKIKGLIYLVNDEFLPNDVEKEYLENKHKYNYYDKVVIDYIDYFSDGKNKDRTFLKFNPNKKYIFDINVGYGEQQFKSTIKDALGLAINYETDLGYNGVLLLSPMGFDWEENHKLIEKCVGKENLSKSNNTFGWFIPYRNPHSNEIEWLEKEKTIKM